MPTSAQIRNRLREYLDDRDPALFQYKQGVFYTDDELNTALTEAQWAVFTYLVKKRQTYLVQNLLVSISGTTTVPVPFNYAFAASAEIADNTNTIFRPAGLFIGWPTRAYARNSYTYMVSVSGGLVFFWRNGTNTGITGRLWYYRSPITFQSTTSHTEFDDRVYNAIIYLAEAILQIKDSGAVNKHGMRYLQAVGELFNEQNSQHPTGLNSEITP